MPAAATTARTRQPLEKGAREGKVVSPRQFLRWSCSSIVWGAARGRADAGREVVDVAAQEPKVRFAARPLALATTGEAGLTGEIAGHSAATARTSTAHPRSATNSSSLDRSIGRRRATGNDYATRSGRSLPLRVAIAGARLRSACAARRVSCMQAGMWAITWGCIEACACAPRISLPSPIPRMLDRHADRVAGDVTEPEIAALERLGAGNVGRVRSRLPAASAAPPRCTRRRRRASRRSLCSARPA